MPHKSHLIAATIGIILACTPAAPAADYWWDGPVGGFRSFCSLDGWWGVSDWPVNSDAAHFSRQVDQAYHVTFPYDITNQELHVHTGHVAFWLNNSTYTVSQSVNVGDTSGHSATLYLTDGTLQSNNAALGSTAGATGNVVVKATANWENSGDLNVGEYGTGTLTIQDGGQVSNEYGYIGFLSSADGEATVTGSGSTWSTSQSFGVGVHGTGALTIQDGGQVSDRYGVLGWESGSSGQATVTGSGTTWSNSDGLYVGNGGMGALTIQEGGQVSSTYGDIGCVSGSSGQATVTGSGTTWSNSDRLHVGLGGMGTLTIQEGGQVSDSTGFIARLSGSTGEAIVRGSGSKWLNSGGLTVGNFGSGTLTIEDGGEVSSNSAYISYYAGSAGQVTVKGSGSKWSNSSDLTVGRGGTGTLAIQDGGQVSNQVGFLGDSPGSSGQVNVTGSGSTWSNSGDLFVGRYGTGTLTIQEGGQVSNAYGILGQEIDSSGQVTVTGNGSKWSNSGDLNVGDAGTGTLSIQDGGQVSNEYGFIGFSSSADGEATVTGSGSKWSNSGDLNVGDEGTGTLTIQGGGQVSNLGGDIGRNSNSDGHVTVTGSGATWSNSGELCVGNSGSGTLAIEAGGEVSCERGAIGETNGSNGQALVTGVGSSWRITSGSLYLGGTSTAPGGLASLTITDGGHVFVNEMLEVRRADAALVIDGGTLSVGSLEVPSGFRIELNDPVGGAAALTVHGVGTDATFSGTITDTLGGTGSLCKAGANNLTLTGLLSYSGSTYVDEGTLVLPAGMYVPGDMVQIGAGGTVRAGNIINRAVAGEGTIIAESDTLLIGDSTRADGFSFDGHLNVEDNSFMLLDTDAAELGELTTLATGGRLNSLAGIQLGPDSAVDPVRIITAGGEATIASNFTNNGAVNGPTGDDWLTFTDDVTGAGSYTGNVVFSDQFSPGNSPAAVLLENVLLDPTGSLLMEIGGTDPGTQHDQLVVAGLAELGGTLQLELLGDYALENDASYELITGSTTGRFGNVLGLSPGWEIFYTPSAVVLATPEPSTLALLLTGLAALAAARIRRRVR